MLAATSFLHHWNPWMPTSAIDAAKGQIVAADVSAGDPVDIKSLWHRLDDICRDGHREDFDALCSVLGIHSADAAGWSPLHFACFHNQPEWMDALLRKGVSAHRLTGKKYSVLHLAGEANAKAAARRSIEAGVALDLVDREGMTALHKAAWNGGCETARALLGAGCAPDIQDIRGMTAFHWAARGDHACVVQALLEFGADPYLVDDSSKDAFAIAKTAGAQSVLVHLLPWQQRRELDLNCPPAPAENRKSDRL